MSEKPIASKVLRPARVGKVTMRQATAAVKAVKADNAAKALAKRKVKMPAKKGKLSVATIKKAVAKVSRERDIKDSEIKLSSRMAKLRLEIPGALVPVRALVTDILINIDPNHSEYGELCRNLLPALLDLQRGCLDIIDYVHRVTHVRQE